MSSTQTVLFVLSLFITKTVGHSTDTLLIPFVLFLPYLLLVLFISFLAASTSIIMESECSTNKREIEINHIHFGKVQNEIYTQQLCVTINKQTNGS